MNLYICGWLSSITKFNVYSILALTPIAKKLIFKTNWWCNTRCLPWCVMVVHDGGSGLSGFWRWISILIEMWMLITYKIRSTVMKSRQHLVKVNSGKTYDCIHEYLNMFGILVMQWQIIEWSLPFDMYWVIKPVLQYADILSSDKSTKAPKWFWDLSIVMGGGGMTY